MYSWIKFIFKWQIFFVSDLENLIPVQLSQIHANRSKQFAFIFDLILAELSIPRYEIRLFPLGVFYPSSCRKFWMASNVLPIQIREISVNEFCERCASSLAFGGTARDRKRGRNTKREKIFHLSPTNNLYADSS